jgi:hypothetical protein
VKQKDVMLFLVVGIVSAIVSVMASNFLINPSKNKSQKAEVVEPISAEFNVPASDNKYFNSNAINPTKLIQIGDSSNKTAPFNAGGN